MLCNFPTISEIHYSNLVDIIRVRNRKSKLSNRIIEILQSFKDEWYQGHRLTALLLQRRQLLILKMIRLVILVVVDTITIIIKIQMDELITRYNLITNNLYCKLKNQRIKLLRRLLHHKLMLMIILMLSQLRWWWNKLRITMMMMMMRVRFMMMNNLKSNNNNKIMIMIMMMMDKIQLDMMVMEHRTSTSIIRRRSYKTFCRAVIFFKSTLLTIF